MAIVTPLRTRTAGPVVYRPPEVPSSFDPLPENEGKEQPDLYTMVFTDVYKTSVFFCGTPFYRVVIGQKKQLGPGGIRAVEDRISIVEVSPYVSVSMGYSLSLGEEEIDLPDSQIAEIPRKLAIYFGGKENLDLAVNRSEFNGVVFFDNVNGLYLTLFPVAGDEADKDIREEFGYPMKSVIIPTFSREPFPYVQISEEQMLELGRLQYQSQKEENEASSEKLYDKIYGYAEQANAGPGQYLPFDKVRVPKSFSSWDVLNLGLFDDEVVK